MIKTIIASAALAALALPAQAVVSVTSPSFTYAQSFDSLATTGTANAWVNDSTITGWSLFSNTGASVATYRADAGGSNTGALYSYGTGTTTDRALGSVASGSFTGAFAVAFTNTTGGTLDSFTLDYSGEQWRNGGNTTAQKLTVEYGFGSSYATAAWTAAGSGFNFTSPVATATAAAVNGNTAGLVTGLGGTVATTWSAGDTLWVRWVDINDSGNDHGLAIDNLSFSVTSAVPEPGTYAMLLAGLAAIGFMVRRRQG